jgi:hypothetical protein
MNVRVLLILSLGAPAFLSLKADLCLRILYLPISLVFRDDSTLSVLVSLPPSIPLYFLPSQAFIPTLIFRASSSFTS